ALLYALQADRGYRLQHEITLTNPVSPLASLVADDGAFCTFYTWHKVGFGNVPAIYASSGTLVRGWELADLYPKDKIELIPQSVSSRYWRWRPIHFFAPQAQQA